MKLNINRTHHLLFVVCREFFSVDLRRRYRRGSGDAGVKQVHPNALEGTTEGDGAVWGGVRRIVRGEYVAVQRIRLNAGGAPQCTTVAPLDNY